MIRASLAPGSTRADLDAGPDPPAPLLYIVDEPEAPATDPLLEASAELIVRLRTPLLASLWGSELLLAVLHAWFTWAPEGTFHRDLVRLFNVDREANLPAWFSASQLLVLAAVLAATALASRQRRIVWVSCAALAVFLSADEAAAIHELAGTISGELFEASSDGSVLAKLASFPSYYWAVVYVPIALPIGMIALWQLWRELGPNRAGVIVGAAVFLTGAVLLDHLEGRYGSDDHTRIPIFIAGVTYRFDIFLLEELCEMAGVTLALDAMLRHLRRTLLA